LTSQETIPGTPDWRSSSWLAMCEIALVILIFVADYRHLIFFSKTPYLLALGWISLWLRRKGWKDVGLKRFRDWRTTITLGCAAGILLEILELFVTQPVLIRLTGKQPDLSDFQVLIGNFKILLLGLVLAWVLAGLGEELVYRGYLMNRVADLIENRRIAWGASLVLVSVLFGFAHLYQGRTGVLDEGLMGLLLGALYLGCGRSLAVPIIAHGVQDTVDLLLIYLGQYPGMG
jgi:membrane protease YdiL (CAAX protease family)